MAESSLDPRETPIHPRHASSMVGHHDAFARIVRAFDSGNLHHAWLLCGPKGIGKATFAYRFAAHVLDAGRADKQAVRWIASRAHPSLFVLERSFDFKTKRLKADIAVDDVRAMLDFLGKTVGGNGWRVVIVDQADDLNKASANALLKAMEEPPSRTLMLLVCNNVGRIMRTIRSRCVSLHLDKLADEEARSVVLPILEDRSVDPSAIELAMTYGAGSPGAALDVATSVGTKAFAAFAGLGALTPNAIIDVARHFTGRAVTARDFEIFSSLLGGWIAQRARAEGLAGEGATLAHSYLAIRRHMNDAEAYNLDKRHAVVYALSELHKALRAA
jgi:DNA polymerase III subunit delta'